MKKFWFAMLICIFTGISAGFSQESESADVQTAGEHAAAMEQRTADEESVQTALPAANSDSVSEDGEQAAKPVANSDSTDEHSSAVQQSAAHGGSEQPAEAGTASDSAGAVNNKEAAGDNKLYTYQTAEMNEPTLRTKRRAVSMHTGFKISALVANNAVSLTEFFGNKMVIDLNKLDKKTIRSGLHGGTLVDFDWFFQFTVLEEHTIKLSTTLDVRAWANVSKSLLTFVAKGNSDGKPVVGNLNATASAFIDTGVMYQLKKPSYGFSARLAYFVPLVYMKNPQAIYRFATNAAGKPSLRVEADMNIYGHLLSLATQGGTINIAQLFKDGGLDLSLAGSYQPTDWVNITGGIDYLPLMVVTMNKGMRNYFRFEGELADVLESIGKKDAQFFKSNLDYSVLSANLPSVKIMRPCKIRLGADFKPFQNNYLILSPFLALPVVNVKPFYMDGGLKIESRFAKVLGVSFDTSYIERIWRHELAFFLDSRWATFTLAASLASHDFARTFTTISGLGIRFGVGIGF